MSSNGESGSAIDRVAPWPSMLNAPFCYKYGHDWDTKNMFETNCRRCGFTKSDIVVYGLALGILTAPLYLLYVRIKEYWREKHAA